MADIGDLDYLLQGEKETMIQRFLRLRCEVGELLEELDSMTSAGLIM